MVGRLLLLTRDHQQHGGVRKEGLEMYNAKKSTNIKIAENTFTEQQREMVASFSASLREPEAGEKGFFCGW